ncbi:MAG: carbohydrate ABC transporter permease [Oscillospiraceae bacterium]|jgi:putative aldouronate transport system permease protein|nr:carbohydrate ABC transporter permease [Oscillospiraceae bacterium]
MVAANKSVPRKKPHIRKKPGAIIADALIYAVLAAVSLTCVMPFVHVLAKSLSSEAYVIARKVFLWPMGWTFSAYQKVFYDHSITRSMGVSIFVTVLFTLLGLVLTVCAAYPLSRTRLRGRRVFTFMILITLYFSGGMIPDYLLTNSLGMLESLTSLILPLAFSAYNFLIMKTSLQSSFPDSLEEAARIEGAGYFRILWSFVLPLSKPILMTIALFLAVGRWNAYQDALFFIKQRADLRPMQLKLYYLIVAATESFQASETVVAVRTNPEVLKAACVMFATVPILCIYPFIQRYFVQGVMIGAVKG